MHGVRVQRQIIGVAAEAVFDRIVDFESYHLHSAAIHGVTTEISPTGELLSHWRARFRNGTAEWTELDTIDRDALVTRFEQVSGDFEHFSGSWRVTPHDTGALVVFEAVFDMGMPSLAELVNPVAERALSENISQIIDGIATAEGSLASDLSTFAGVPAA